MERSRLLAALAMVAAIPLAIVTAQPAPASKEIWIPAKPKPAVEAVAAAPSASPGGADAPAMSSPEATASTGPAPIVPKPAPATPPPEKPKPTPGVVVGVLPTEPIVAGKTILWTAAFQSAWDALADQSSGDPKIELGDPAKPEVVKAMNDGRFPPESADGVAVIVAGKSDAKAWKKIDKAIATGHPEDAPAPGEKDSVLFAKFEKLVRYDVGFARAAEPLAFGEKKTPVHAYGVLADAKDDDPVERRRRAQILVHVPPSTPEADMAKTSVIELIASAGTRVIVSGRAPKATLEETWKDASELLKTPGVAPAAGSRVSIPRVGVDVARTYNEFIPTSIKDEDSMLVFARQDAILTADERSVVGADKPTKADDPGGTKMDLVVDGPFLVAFMAPKAERPFLLLWVGSEDGLSR